MQQQIQVIDAVLSGLFDYAGMFPPASLSLEASVNEGLRFNKTLKKPSLVRNQGVFNPEDLKTVAGLLTSLSNPEGERFKVSVLLTADDGFGQAVKEILQILGDNQRIHLTAIELKLSSEADFYKAIELGKAFSGTRIFLEPVKEIQEQAIRFAVRNKFGIKVRAAGPSAVSTEELANLISKLAETKTPLKVTQGLHAPFISGAAPTGFLSLALATYFARSGASASQIRNILCIADLGQIYCGANEENTLRYEQLKLPQGKIKDLNKDGIICIGSCSIKEPDDYLANLNLS